MSVWHRKDSLKNRPPKIDQRVDEVEGGILDLADIVAELFAGVMELADMQARTDAETNAGLMELGDMVAKLMESKN